MEKLTSKFIDIQPTGIQRNSRSRMNPALDLRGIVSHIHKFMLDITLVYILSNYLWFCTNILEKPVERFIILSCHLLEG
jgi:hypothetical protein